MNPPPPRIELRRVAAALVASLLSQALLSLFLPLSDSPQNAPSPQFLLLLDLLSHFQIVTATSLVPANARKRKWIRQQDPSPLILPPSPASNPDPFELSFKVSSSTFEWLSGLLDPLLHCRDPSGLPLLLPGPTRLAIALSRLSSSYPTPTSPPKPIYNDHSNIMREREYYRLHMFKTLGFSVLGAQRILFLILGLLEALKKSWEGEERL